MNFTCFEDLKNAIRALGAEPVIAKIKKQLVSKGISIEDFSDQVVVGQKGIYFVDPQGALTKVIIHIVDINVESRHVRDLKIAVEKGDFESSSVLEQLHRYHLMKCQTIKMAEKEGWRKYRYRMSRRQDGKFFYRFVTQTEVLIEREGQRLYVCKNCLHELKRVTNSTFIRDSFNLEGFLSSSINDLLNLEKDGKYANECAPNISQKDWEDISRNYRKQKNYQCENPDCPKPDLSETRFRKYLHTHHMYFDKSDNNYLRLKALCIFCHDKQPGHSLKNLPEYKEYIKDRGLN